MWAESTVLDVILVDASCNM